MPSIVEAQATLRRIGSEVKSVMDNPQLTKAQKKAKFDELEVSMTKAKDAIEQYKSASKLAGSMFSSLEQTTGPSFGTTAGVKGISSVSPLAFDETQLRALHDAMVHHTRFRITGKGVGFDGSVTTKDGVAPTPSAPGVGGMLPPQYTGLVPMLHEPTRVLDLIPATATDAAVIEYLTHQSTTGTAGVVAPGTVKPSVALNVTRNTATMTKLAVTATLNDEDILDFEQFSQYVGLELSRMVIDAENSQVLNGDGENADLTGLLTTPGILTRAAATDETNIDTIEQAIADLRTGPAYTEPTAIVVHPNTWSSTRREKDSMGRYLLNADPALNTLNSLWGIQVLATTTMPVGEALMFNGQAAAMAYIRQGITVETDYGQHGFEFNQHTFRCEERFTVTVQRPAAMVAITGLT
ncbi:phage major capsid protein [Rudaeicoccus suwonensis]|uniref:HK97 family phage major capsid protein n=1 Tax=Rudaeicoccus suwonensis TaxID=657409 RepID=A0A561ECB5_9MICO|nr:phage major capsid protein [Rudaeicoccus suwonensis]TWE13256.1 HK97 family phage major capsid protein [Rudaeicoccus suwonensis]